MSDYLKNESTDRNSVVSLNLYYIPNFKSINKQEILLQESLIEFELSCRKTSHLLIVILQSVYN
jgi:hypothetical protein